MPTRKRRGWGGTSINTSSNEITKALEYKLRFVPEIWLFLGHEEKRYPRQTWTHSTCISCRDLYFILLKIAYFQASGCRCGWKPHLRGTHVAIRRSLLQKTQFLTARSIVTNYASRITSTKQRNPQPRSLKACRKNSISWDRSGTRVRIGPPST